MQAAHIYASADPYELVIPIGVGDASFTAHSQTPYYCYGGKGGVMNWSGDPVSPFSGAPVYRMGTPHRPLNGVWFKEPFPELPGPRGGTPDDWTRDARWDLDVYRCPADGGFSGMHHAGWRDSGLSAYDFYGTSYIANSRMVKHLVENRSYSISPYLRPLSAVPVPDLTIGYMESAAQYAIFANNTDDFDQSSCYWPYPMGAQVAHGWHGQDFRFNMAFLDGHVGNAQIRGYGRQPSEICPPEYLCECIALRSPDWRMDTFPAPALPTVKTESAGAPGIFEVVP